MAIPATAVVPEPPAPAPQPVARDPQADIAAKIWDEVLIMLELFTGLVILVVVLVVVVILVDTWLDFRRDS